MKNSIKQYCKDHKLKFEHLTKEGFIASEIVKIKAARKKGGYKFVTAAKKRIYTNFLLVEYKNYDDIIIGGTFKKVFLS